MINSTIGLGEVGLQVRKMAAYIKSLNLTENSKIEFYLKIVHIG